MIPFGYYNMDCMEGMRKFPDNYFELAIVDPPYFAGPNNRKFYGHKVSPIGVNRVFEAVEKGYAEHGVVLREKVSESEST